jgi:hypothetical protein
MPIDIPDGHIALPHDKQEWINLLGSDVKQFNRAADRWRADNPNELLDLSYANKFIDANGEERSLWSADLTGDDMTGPHLQRTNLKGAYLHRAKLRMAFFEDANLQQANLQGADLSYAQMQGADLRYALLHGVRLMHARLDGATFSSEDQVKLLERWDYEGKPNVDLKEVDGKPAWVAGAWWARRIHDSLLPREGQAR